MHLCMEVFFKNFLIIHVIYLQRGELRYNADDFARFL